MESKIIKNKLNDLYEDMSNKNLNIHVPFTRKDFPDGFVFGAASAAYQYEGGAAEGGRGITNWDDFALNYPERIEDGSNANVTCYQYKMFEEDVKLMKNIDLDAYRLSIAWARVLPGGKLSAGINKEGIKYYSDLIDALLAEGITPYVTLFHWDLPLSLQNAYGGFLSEDIVKDFRDYAELCFFEFGDRVKHWVTFNEPWTYTYGGYVVGSMPPGRSFSETLPSNDEHIGYKGTWRQFASEAGDPGTEPYLVAHHIILSHAAAVATYRNQFQAYQGGEIGMVNVINWFEPLDPERVGDQNASRRGMDFQFGWFVAPQVTGDYPKSMRDRVGDRLPYFTPTQTKLVQGSYDFLGVNYYTSYYATIPLYVAVPNYPDSYIRDMDVLQTAYRKGVPIGKHAASSWLYIVPWGIKKAVKYIQQEYNDPIIYITENGVDKANEPKHTMEQARHDHIRIEYHREHLKFLLEAIAEGVKIKSYFMWTLCDNYEWGNGYTVRFGIFYVDFECGRLTRYPKRSALWWGNVLRDSIAPLKSSLKRQIQETEVKNDLPKRKRANN